MVVNYKAVRGYTRTKEDHTIKVYARNKMTGFMNTMLVDLSSIEFENAFSKWVAGGIIQEAFPNLGAYVHEFFLSGMTVKEQMQLEEPVKDQ